MPNPGSCASSLEMETVAYGEGNKSCRSFGELASMTNLIPISVVINVRRSYMSYPNFA